MMSTVSTPADHLPPPSQWKTEDRYLGYKESDYQKPYAHYFKSDITPLQEHILPAIVAGMSPTEWGYSLSEAARLMEAPGYLKMETGWTRLLDGTILVSVLTKMPGVTAEMLDWWIAWHSVESARYKLWYPDAHQFAAWADDRSKNTELSNRERYRDNVSFVDEYIGGVLTRLAIHFYDPARVGFSEKPGDTVLCAYGTSPLAPVGSGGLVHQIRATEDGCEMRSRFWLGGPLKFYDLPSDIYENNTAANLLKFKPLQSLISPFLKNMITKGMPPSIGTDMLFHCAAEMNHLASFLPDLYAEFKDDF